MKSVLRVAILAFAISGVSELFAQPGCPAVNAGGDITIPCGQTCTTLNATAFSAATTTAYTVGQIPYNPPFTFNTGTSILVATDDVWGNIINLPFNFCFFGNTYGQIVVGSNGVISFNTANATLFNSWDITDPIPTNIPADLLNSIMGPWQDIDPTNQGDVFYRIDGTFPCRSFTVSWYQTPYFGDPNSVTTGNCPNPLFATQQIVIYETTNAIEMYIQNKEACPGWNDGWAVEGIVNATGTLFYTVPGRNGTVWTAQNDAWRFTPAGAPNYTINWFDGSTQIGTGSSIQVCPSTSRVYTAQATYTNCDNATTVVTDNIFVGLAGLTAQIDSVRNPICFGSSTGAVYGSFNTGSAVLSYGWSPGGANQTSLTNIPAGTYTFTVSDANNCSSSQTVTLVDPPQLLVDVPDSNAYACTLGGISGSLVANPSGGTGVNYSYLWSNTFTTRTISGLSAGTYIVTVTDANGCTASDAGAVVPIISGNLILSASSVDATCGNNNGSAAVDVTSGTGPFTYAWSNQGNTQTITGLGAGTYDVTVTGAGGCSATASTTVGSTGGLTLSASATDATCGNNNGSATVDVTVGIGPYTYIWSNQGNTQTITGLGAGTYDVTVTGFAGCSATASVTVTASVGLTLSITGTDAPCQANSGSATVDVTAGSGPFTYLWSNQGNTQTITGLSGGTYSVTVTGLGGCSATATVSIAVGDVIPPIAVCRNITVAIGIGIVVVDAADIDAGSSDNCVTYTTSVAPTTFDCTKLGPHTITLTVTDAAGNFSICNALVNVTDTTAPEAFCQDVTISLSGNVTSVTVAAIDNGSRDNCGIVSRDISQETFDCSNVGVNVVTLTVADGANNVSSCNANVTVEDNTPPVAVCQDISVVLATTTASISPTDIDNGSTDNCAIVLRAVTPDIFDCSNLGANNVTFSATDASNNSSSCNAIVTVSDITPPAAVCQDITISLIGTSASITAVDVDNGSTDNCAIISRTVTPDLFDCSNIGANLTTLTVTDASNNSSNCNATVTIVGGLPVAVCQDITVVLLGSSITITAADVDGGSSSDCGVLSAVVVPDIFDCSNLGSGNTATLTVTDAFGNTSSCNAIVTVIDNTAPDAICQDITVSLATTTVSITPADVDNNSTDNCAIVLRTVVPDLFDCSNLGANQATFTAADASGNSSSCTASVTVNDLIPPTAVCQDIAKTLSGSSASITPAEIDNNSTDNCAIVSRTVTPETFDCTNIGPNAVTFTATDASGNSSSCNATVTISDVTPPVAITRDITVSLIGSSVSITAAQIDNASTDNCTIVSRTVVPDLFDCSNLGPNPVMLTVTDQSGNTASAPATVTVVDDTPPTALCRNHSVTLVNGVASITTADVDNASTDNCTIVSRTVVPSEFTCATLGLNTAVLTVTDQSGNVSSCNADVTVIGAAPFSCFITSILAPSNQITGGNSTTIYIGYGPQSTTLSSTITGQGQFTYSWAPITGLSCTNCLSPVFTPTAQGNYTFTLTVTGSSGCSSTCEITICVLDVRADAGCNGGGGNGGNGGGNSPGKIYVCHFPPGNIANMQLICIGVAGVPAHVPFHGGDRLGRCDLVCGSNKLEDEEVPELIADHNGAGFEMLIYPNPFSGQFQVKVESESTEPINMRVFNVMGQLVISRKGVEPNEDIQMGSHLANGFYFLEVQQAGFKKVVRLLKVR